MDPASAISLAAGVLSLAIQVAEKTHSYTTGVKDAPQVIEQLYSEVRALAEVLEQLKAFLVSEEQKSRLFTETSLLVQTLSGCWEQLTALDNRLSKPQHESKLTNAIRRAKWPLEKDDTLKLVEWISRCVQTLHFSLSIKGLTLLSETSSKILPALQEQLDISKKAFDMLKDYGSSIASNEAQDIMQQLESVVATISNFSQSSGALTELKETVSFLKNNAVDNDVKEALSWLNAPDTVELHQKALSTRISGTGNWFLTSDAFQAFQNDGKGFLWLHGIAGCGKTILSSSIIEQLRASCQASSNISLAYFYFSFTAQALQKSESVVSSLVSQLATGNSECQQLLCHFRKCHTGRRPTLPALIDTLKEMTEKYQRTYFVIDALDECNNYGDVLGLLAGIRGWQIPGCNMLVTSRSLIQLEEGLLPLVSRVMPFPSQEVESDIQKFVQAQLENDVELQKWPPDTRKEIEIALINGSDGMFRWASCQLDEIRKCYKLKILRQTLKTLPRGLDATYERMLVAIDTVHHPDVISILMWLSYSKQPLTPEAIAEVVAINMDDRPPFSVNNRLRDSSDLFRMCGSLLTTRTQGIRTYVTLGHLSVKDFLTHSRITKSSVAKFQVNEVIAIDFIAKCCVAYNLSIPPDTSIDRSRPPQFYETTVRKKYPLIQHARDYWAVYSKEAASSQSSQLMDLIVEFLVSNDRACFDEFSCWKAGSWFTGYNKEAFENPDVGSKNEDTDVWVDHDGFPQSSFRLHLTPLCQMIKIDFTTVALKLLEQGEDPNEWPLDFTYKSCPPLYYAISRTNYEVTRALLSRGALLDKPTNRFISDGYTKKEMTAEWVTWLWHCASVVDKAEALTGVGAPPQRFTSLLKNHFGEPPQENLPRTPNWSEIFVSGKRVDPAVMLKCY